MLPLGPVPEGTRKQAERSYEDLPGGGSRRILTTREKNVFRLLIFRLL